MSPALDKPLTKGCPPEEGWGRLNNDPGTAAGCPRINSAEQPHVKAITVTDNQPEKSAWNASKAICCSVPLLRQQQKPCETTTKPWKSEFQSLKGSELQAQTRKQALFLRTLLTGLCLNIPSGSYFAFLCREDFLGYPCCVPGRNSCCLTLEISLYGALEM